MTLLFLTVLAVAALVAWPLLTDHDDWPLMTAQAVILGLGSGFLLGAWN